jgi:trimeric autotransporter adhesin
MEDQMKARKSWTHWLGMVQLVKVSIALLAFSLTIGVALAQVRNSTITGTVTDQSGAVVPKAIVTVTNQLTNEIVRTQSGSVGDYAIPYLAAGRYIVSIDAPGFKTYRVNDVAVETGVTVQVNAKLAIGATSQVVQVAASTAELQTESSTVSGSVGTEVINNVPNINNDPLYYATLQAGVVPDLGMYSDENLGVGYEDRLSYSAIRVNGGELGLDDLQVDGVPVQGSGWHEITVMPNRDALQEVTVSTNNLSADLGGGQAIIQMVTKSGTNQFHGDLFYNLRNEQLNANGLANDIQGIPRAKYRVDEAGGSVGGPVMLPKLFNGKDKVFFFVAFDRLWNVEPYTGFATVPTDLQRQGDFGATLIDSNGTPVPATWYNPFTATPTAPGSTTYVRDMYPLETNFANCSSYGCGSVITNPDTYGLMYLNAFPEPNHAPSDVYGDNNYFFNQTNPTTRNNLNTRMDFHFGKNSFYLSGGVQMAEEIGANTWGASSPWRWQNQNDNIDDNPNAAIGDTIALNPTTFIDLHVGFQRVSAQSNYPETGQYFPGTSNPWSAADYTAWGMPAEMQSLILIPGVAPSVYSLGYGVAYSQALNNAQWVWKNEHQNNYDFNGSITKVIRRWTLKEGFDDRIYQSNWADIEWATPSLGSYDTECYCEQYGNANGSSSGLNTNPNQQGSVGTNWLSNVAQAPIGVMGYRLDPGSSPIPALTDRLFAVFTQNDWKATNRLTVNLGLRYEIQPGPTARHNREYDIDTTVETPFTYVPPSGAYSNLVYQNPMAQYGAFAFSGVSGYPRNLWNTEWGNLSPRVGAAYRLTNLTVIRGGYGRIYAQSNTGYNANGTVYGGGAWDGGSEAEPYGLGITTPFNGLPVGRFEDPGGDSNLLLAPGAPVQSPEIYGDENGAASADMFLRNGPHNAYVDQWNVFVERRIHSWLASAGYVGSKGTRLPWRLYPLQGTWQIPQTVLMGWRSGWLASNGTSDPAQQYVSNPYPALENLATGNSGAGEITVMDASEGYLAMQGATVIGNQGSSLYNSLELELQHSYSTGLTAQFNYTYSRATGINGGVDASSYEESQGGHAAGGGGFNYLNPQSNYGLLDFDTPQRFLGTVSYLSQWGSGGKYELASPISRALAGGWQIATVVTVQSGQPWGPSCSGSIDSKCIPTGQSLEVPKTLQHWYNGSQSVTLPDGHVITPPAYTYLKWNPDAFTSQIVQFPNGNYSVDQYWYGTTKMYDGRLRVPAFKNTNLNITRQFTIRERYKFELLGEFTDLFNNQNFLPSAVNNTISPITSASVGAIGENSNSSAGTLSAPGNMMDPRQITLTARFTF